MMRSPSGRYLAVQRDDELIAETSRRNRPWTTTDYERLRKAAVALTKTHTSVDLSGRQVMSAFDGAAYWELLGALARTGRDD